MVKSLRYFVLLLLSSVTHRDVGIKATDLGQGVVNCGPGEKATLVFVSLTCGPCDEGTYQDSLSHSEQSCITCLAGTFSGPGADSCTKCPAGQYAAEGASSCTKCTAGHFAAGRASSSCSLCNPGTYQDQEEASACKVCLAGTYSDFGATECTECPEPWLFTSRRQDPACDLPVEGINWISGERSLLDQNDTSCAALPPLDPVIFEASKYPRHRSVVYVSLKEDRSTSCEGLFVGYRRSDITVCKHFDKCEQIYQYSENRECAYKCSCKSSDDLCSYLVFNENSTSTQVCEIYFKRIQLD